MTSFGQFTENNRSETSHDSPKNISFLKEQITTLKIQLEKANTEKDNLLNLLKTEQSPTFALSPAAKPTLWKRLTGRKLDG